MTEEKETLVNDPISKVFKKIGITGIAAAIFTMVFGLVIIIYPLEWEDAKLLIGLFLFIPGLVNLTGYVVSIVSRHRAMKTYVETETMKEMKEM